MTRKSPTASDLATHLMRLTRLLRAPAHVSVLNPAQWDVMRFLARANRFSRYPAELTAYLGSTKGTVSQTLMSLEGKGLVGKERDADNARRVRLSLTKEGRQALRTDPVRSLEKTLAKIPAKQADDMAKGLSSLAEALAGKNANTFGACPGCRHFNKAKGKKTPNCALFDTTLSVAETQQLCAYHAPARG